MKDIKRRHEKCHGKRNQDAFGEKCHREPQNHKGIGRDHKEIDDKVIHGDLEGSSPCHLRHTGTDDKHRETVDTRYQMLETIFILASIYPTGLSLIQAHKLTPVLALSQILETVAYP